MNEGTGYGAYVRRTSRYTQKQIKDQAREIGARVSYDSRYGYSIETLPAVSAEAAMVALWAFAAGKRLTEREQEGRQPDRIRGYVGLTELEAAMVDGLMEDANRDRALETIRTQSTPADMRNVLPPRPVKNLTEYVVTWESRQFLTVLAPSPAWAVRIARDVPLNAWNVGDTDDIAVWANDEYVEFDWDDVEDLWGNGVPDGAGAKD